MATAARNAYVYNGYGDYETSPDGKQGTSILFGGHLFFFPYKEVTVIPTWEFRFVDHDKTTPPEGEEGFLTYSTKRVNGAYIVEDMLKTQIPYPNEMKGIIEITGRDTGQEIEVLAGYDVDGTALFEKVKEKEATAAEKKRAEQLALDYKKQIVEEYFQSKRERMSGGHGRMTPLGMTKVFMDEMNVSDIDAISTHQKDGVSTELIMAIIKEMQQANELNGAKLKEAIDSVRKNGNESYLSPQKPKQQGMDAYKAAYESALAAGKTQEEAKEAAIAARGK